MKKILDFIDGMNIWIGRVFSFLILILMFVIMYEVIGRYFFNAPTRWSNEISQYLLACVAMLGAGYCLVHDDHVRVDILHRNFGPQTRALVDILTFLLVLIFVTAILWKGGELCWDALIHNKKSMTILELPLFPSMVMVPIAGCLLGLQGLARALRAFFFLTGDPEFIGEKEIEA
ncbi:MAG: TRAP transporter small permease subunit [Deltaproteobacteria bacterium]|nr:TRAP transporter small permease subunit [Deltaproteobacteria bacterium]MBW2112562.1 TRAP transporter small permease subunit [Deltaproteobacteria bacterium]